MRNYILFSPISGTDPIANCRDGSMLHICRVYKPQKIYLYLSHEMIERHKLDDRYRYCIKKLGELIDHKFEIKFIERPDLKEVQDFDYFYHDFETEIKKIIAENDCELLVNVSSGTPAMQSCLQVIASLSPYKICAIQVDTPNKGMNFKRVEEWKKGDLEKYWKLNEDNDKEKCTVRAHESSYMEFVRKIKKEVIAKYIDAYAYEAAFEEGKANQMGEDVLRLLEVAYCRKQLDLVRVKELLGEDITSILVKEEEEDNRILIEYILGLQVRLKRKEYGDFIRGLTPVIVDLFENVLKKKYGINIKDYCDKEKSKQGYILRRKLLESNRKILNILDGYYKEGGYKDSVYTSAQLAVILRGLANKDKDKELVNMVKLLRKVESNIRNVAAHEIVSVTPKWIKERVGCEVDEILKAVMKMVSYTNIKVTSSTWNSYEAMNERIKAAMNK